MTDRPGSAAEDERGYRPPLLEIAIHPESDSVVVVELRGELDLATGPILQQRLESFAALAGADGRDRTIAYRLSDLEFIDASGLNALLTAWDRADKETITIQEPSRSVRRLLGLLGMDSMIEDEGRPESR